VTDVPLGPLADLLAQVRDLKQVRNARSDRSLAERQFGRAWARLCVGEPVEAVALSETAAAVAAVRLAGLDAGVMMAHEVSEAEAVEALGRAFDDSLPPERSGVAGPLDGGLRQRLRDTLGPLPHGSEPPLVDLLVRQPRAGATHPGLPRLVLEPAESHADHCFCVAAFGVLLAPRFGAEPGRVFLVGLAHHLMNVSLPDAGHAGDVLLGDLAGRLAAVAQSRALATLPEALQPTVRDALDLTTENRFGEPEAQAFHAADVLDRVLEMAWHERSARFRLGDALGSDTAAGQLDICHGGFYQDFQQRVLRDAGLMSDETRRPDDSAFDRDNQPSGSYERGGHGAVPAASPEAQGPGAEDGRELDDGAHVAHLERRELGS
jgi:5'-deoxynucleotidase YfbR-like HD superfamily hydrolase